MTEQRVVIDAQMIAARVFSKEDTKFTKVNRVNFPILYVLGISLVASLRGLGKSFDAPTPRGGGFQSRRYEFQSFLRSLRFLRLILRVRIFYSVASVLSVMKCLLPFGCGRAALGAWL
jgi:hypothetical protein